MKESELSELLTGKLVDARKYLDEFSKAFKYKITSYCAIKNPNNKWVLFYGKIILLPSFLEEQGENIEKEFKEKSKNKTIHSDQINIDIKFEKINSPEEIDKIYIDAIKENKIKNTDEFCLSFDEYLPIFNFFSGSTIPYGDLYIHGKPSIWADCDLHIDVLLKNTPFKNEIELRKYLSLEKHFDFTKLGGISNYIEYTVNSAIHIQFIPPIYFAISEDSDYNGCPIKFNFDKTLEENNIVIDYEFFDFNNIFTLLLKNGTIENDKIKIKKDKQKGGSFDFKTDFLLPDRAKDRWIKFSLKYNNTEIHSFSKSYYKDRVEMLRNRAEIRPIIDMVNSLFIFLKNNWKYIITILPFLGLLEFLWYLFKNQGQLPISLLNPELFIAFPLLYAIVVSVIYFTIFIFPLIIPFYIKEAVNILKSKSDKSMSGKIEKSWVVIYSPLIIIFFLLIEFIIPYIFLNLFFEIHNNFLLAVACVILINLISFSFYFIVFMKKLISLTKYIFIMFCILYFMLSWKYPGLPLRVLKIGGNVPVELSVSKKYINNSDISKYIKVKSDLCNIKKSKTTANINWIHFLLFLKTPDSYYVDCKKSSNIILIPKKYVYSEVFNKK